MAEESEICSWYVGKTIFITGATGFMGKVLLEKLLFSCVGIKRIYVLLRSKRGRTGMQRIEDMWKLPAYQRLKKDQPDAIKKVIAINGDLISDNLGIGPEDRERLRNEVDVIFHVAATLKLEGTLKDAIEMNTAGTKCLIQLAHEMKNLKAFVHLSTAFCNGDQTLMDEKVYDWKDDPHHVIDTVKWMNEEALIRATPEIIAPHPNTYLYSKRLAEILIRDEYPKLPVCVTRPSIVCPAAQEPCAGWVDNLNGPIGLLVGAGKGVIRSMYCFPQYSAHVVPVDYAINALIAIAYKTGTTTQKPKEIPVYNMSQHDIKKVTFGDILDKGRKIVHENPFEGAIWYPGGDARTRKWIHLLYCIFFHFLPAYFIDLLMFIFRQKRFMVRLQWRIQQGLELLQFFTTREWVFKCNNFLDIWNNMSPTDQRIFCIDFDRLDIETFLTISILGARQYCMKEDLKSLPRCRVKQKFLYVIDKLFLIGMYYFIITTLASLFSIPLGTIFEETKTFVLNSPIIAPLTY